MDEVEDSWEREKKHKSDIEKMKRQVEGNLKLTQETVVDLERNKIELGQVLQRKEKENSSLLGKIEDEQTLGGKLNTQIKIWQLGKLQIVFIEWLPEPFLSQGEEV